MTHETTDLTEEFPVLFTERELQRVRGQLEKGIFETAALLKDRRTSPYDGDRAHQALYEYREILLKIGDALNLAHDRFTP